MECRTVGLGFWCRNFELNWMFPFQNPCQACPTLSVPITWFSFGLYSVPASIAIVTRIKFYFVLFRNLNKFKAFDVTLTRLYSLWNLNKKKRKAVFAPQLQSTLDPRMRTTPSGTRAASPSPPTHQKIVAAGVPPQAPGPWLAEMLSWQHEERETGLKAPWRKLLWACVKSDVSQNNLVWIMMCLGEGKKKLCRKDINGPIYSMGRGLLCDLLFSFLLIFWVH